MGVGILVAGAGGLGGESRGAYQGGAPRGAGGAPRRTLLGVVRGGGGEGLRDLWELGEVGGSWEEAGTGGLI